MLHTDVSDRQHRFYLYPPAPPFRRESAPPLVGDTGTGDRAINHVQAGLQVDPLLVLRAERLCINAELATTPEGEDAALWPRLEDVESRILTAEPQTFLGALA